MLYDQVIKGLGPEFIHYKSEIDVPPEGQSKWGKLSPDSCRVCGLISMCACPVKAKERFPTFFAFQVLKQEYEESERRAAFTPNGLLQSPLYHNALLLRQLAQNPHLLSIARRGGEAPAEVPPVRSVFRGLCTLTLMGGYPPGLRTRF